MLTAIYFMEWIIASQEHETIQNSIDISKPDTQTINTENQTFAAVYSLLNSPFPCSANS